jgi:3-hydroxyacyl-CoA dehydrogenase / enoyl-CoA hydratase / 3-hydroxybutyryl-CoA epimerase
MSTAIMTKQETKVTSEALTIEVRDDGVAIVRMDVQGEPVNTLKADFEAQFSRAFETLDRDPRVRAVVFTSGKPDSFIAGADIKMLEGAKTADEAAALSRKGQVAMDRLAGFRAPIVAAIHGPCLGGGLEVALACASRVGSDDKKTKLGLPEVQLGLLPGAGGTQRLPRLVGVQGALDLMLTGRQLDAKRAQKMGLVDEVCPASVLVEVAAERAKKLAAPDAAQRSRPSFGARMRELFSAEGLTELGLEKNPLGRKVLFDRARDATLDKTHGNYPAAERILDVVRHGLDKGMRAGLEAEARAFGELVVSAEAKQLIGIFHATTALKKDRGTDEAGVEPRPVKKVGVLGGGLMGQGIAIVTAQQAGLQVRLRDKDHEAVGRGLSKVRAELDGQLEKRRLTALERDRLMAKVTGTTTYAGFQNADVIIEAVFEDLELKRRIVREVEAVTGATTVFASNTSSLPIKKIAEASKHPETVLGMHYFSPVQKMPLLEIIVTDKTAPWAIATCVELGKKQGKTVIVVRDGPGFYTTRILAPYMNEASRLLSEGVPIEAVDAALVKLGFPVGPIALMDEVGIDVGEKVGHVLHDAFGERMAPVPGAERLIKDGRLGRKSGKGFYRYDVKKGEGEKRPVDESVYELLGVKPAAKVDGEQLAWRCTLLMINEAARCFEEGILRSARDGDIGAIFGLGFPPFRGGPFRVVDTLGAAEVVARLERLRAQHGMRFEPCALLKEMAKTGQTFHGEKKVASRAWKPA